jgi:hypothetical protein
MVKWLVNFILLLKVTLESLLHLAEVVSTKVIGLSLIITILGPWNAQAHNLRNFLFDVIINKFHY